MSLRFFFFIAIKELFPYKRPIVTFFDQIFMTGSQMPWSKAYLIWVISGDTRCYC